MTSLTENTVQIDQIEKELTKLWKNYESEKKYRASFFTLIIYTQDSPRSPYLLKIAKMVIKQYPCRIIFFNELKDDAEKKLEASISVLPTDETQNLVFCDCIHITISPSYRERIPFLAYPLLKPDLPIYFLCGEDPLNQENVMMEFENISDFTIFDSETTTNLPQFAQSLLSLKESTKSEISDLNWARTEEWRHLIASQFSSREKQEQLSQCQEISINYHAPKSSFFEHPKVQSIYLASWLATRFDWKLKKTKSKKGNTILTFSHDEGTTSVTLTEEETPCSPTTGRVEKITFLLAEQHLLTMQRDPKHPFKVLCEEKIGMDQVIPSYQIFTKEESGQSLVNEIFHPTHKHFLSVLEFVKELDKGVSCE